ncbi:MAG: UdgX family uracil-DNA binding protein [Acidimicrobiales bacterium]|nr:UdgX family uracil-DNA binding protein [Acidimicrobiales bacterium]MBO0893785.1 UdgX family uracil-DNA binding protein [Acidimicrobiales bacterium]
MPTSRPTRLSALKDEASHCTACDLYRDATQTVFGSGLERAKVVLVGEQPGDKEDLAGEPFVGPAGRILDRALDAASLDRREVYLTNVVKHFKFRRQGKVRLHKRPTAAEVAACRHWLDQELALLQPTVLVCLGATATQALMGSRTRVTRDRGRLMDWEDMRALVTVHPSSILRAPDPERRHQEMESFVNDLRVVASALRR